MATYTQTPDSTTAQLFVAFQTELHKQEAYFRGLVESREKESRALYQHKELLETNIRALLLNNKEKDEMIQRQEKHIESLTTGVGMA